MGIETGLTALGMSATTASAVTAGLYSAAIGAAVTAATAPKPQKAETPTAINPGDKPPGVQAEKAVDRSALLNRNAAAAGADGAFAGQGSTLLTGARGINSSSLNLGTSTLLGQ